MARPRKFDKVVRPTSVYLDDDLIEHFRLLGNGNLSEGVRRLGLESMARESVFMSVSIIEGRIAELYASIEQSRRDQAKMEARALSEIERLESLKCSLGERTDG